MRIIEQDLSRIDCSGGYRLEPLATAGLTHDRVCTDRRRCAKRASLRKRESVAGLALEFRILTATREGEALGARWSEFDLDAKVWRSRQSDESGPRASHSSE
jgi:integrase